MTIYALIVRVLFSSLLGFFLTPAGLVVLGVLDSSLIFFLPLGIDFVVILASARTPNLFWLHALMATVGSLIGAAVTYWVGQAVGEKGLKRFVSPARLERVQRRVTDTAAAAIGALAIIPPPFPFTAFVLTSGALALNPWTLFGTLAAVRLFRFGAESALAAHYGSLLLVWMDSTAFEAAVTALIAFALIGTIASGVAVYRGSRQAR
jgi:membrane protein YqaA with SNARE-associated domain